LWFNRYWLSHQHKFNPLPLVHAHTLQFTKKFGRLLLKKTLPLNRYGQSLPFRLRTFSTFVLVNGRNLVVSESRSVLSILVVKSSHHCKKVARAASVPLRHAAEFIPV